MDFKQLQQMPAVDSGALRILAGRPVRLRGEWRLAPFLWPAAIQIRCEPHLP